MTEENDKKNARSEKEKVGVYICYCGGNISDHVDVEKVRERMEKVPGVAVARTNMFMCSDPGQEMIMKDLNDKVVNRVVVASCSPTLHETTFRGAISRAGANPYLYEHANIREQVSWVHHGDQATDKATRLVAAAAAKARGLKPLDPIKVDAKLHATVIGGGIAGLRAAKDLADRGIPVAIIEKSPLLGGQVSLLDKIAPTGENAADILMDMAGQVIGNPLITIHTSSFVDGFSGYVGNFTLNVKKNPPNLENAKGKMIEEMAKAHERQVQYLPFTGIYPGWINETNEDISIKTGVIILATGFSSYKPQKGEYGYQEFNEVITLPDFIQKMAQKTDNEKYLDIDGKKIRSVAMIHCVGSRHIPGVHSEDESGILNEYCSRTCCTATLNAANTIRENCPGTRVYEFYRDIRTYGRGQEDLYEKASGNKVIFLRFVPEDGPEVIRNNQGSGFPLIVKTRDTLTFGEEVEVPVDLVVLATGMVPNDVSDLVDMMKLPVGMDRFLLEVHPKLRPVELPITGILLAGTCQAPMDVGEACNAASAAAVKATSLLCKGFVELDPFVAEVDPEKCRGTGACVDACLSEGALNLVEREIDGKMTKKAEVAPAFCLGCGACVAVCDENAIDVNGWTLKQYEDMVDMIASDEAVAD